MPRWAESLAKLLVLNVGWHGQDVSWETFSGQSQAEQRSSVLRDHAQHIVNGRLMPLQHVAVRDDYALGFGRHLSNRFEVSQGSRGPKVSMNVPRMSGTVVEDVTLEVTRVSPLPREQEFSVAGRVVEVDVLRRRVHAEPQDRPSLLTFSSPVPHQLLSEYAAL